ncbi:MAG: hypothetical protein GX162_08870 [Firmicutes bacterium]|jgi:hypothetical protein|nr:hypothetical protein [Bacillota bacterium]
MFKSKKARVVRTLGPLLASLIIGYLLAYALPFPGRRPSPTSPDEANLVAEVILEPRIPSEEGLHGPFTVTARLVNEGPEDLHDLLVVADQMHALSGYPSTPPKSERKVQYIAILPAGKQVSLRFTGFQTFHPEEKQEIIVSVLGYPGVRKTVYQAILAPED